MAYTLKIQKLGDGLGVVLPEELLEELGVGEGDLLYPVWAKEGLRLTPCDEGFAQTMDAGRDFMKRHKNAMKKLAEE